MGCIFIKKSFFHIHSFCRDLIGDFISEYYSKKEKAPTYIRSEIRYVATSTIFVSLILTIIHLLIIRGIISYETCRTYLYLRIGTPGLSNIFFSNYIHNSTDITHLFGNISRFFVAAVLICIMIWYLQRRGVFFPGQFYRRTITFFLLGVPFLISSVSLVSGRMQGIGYIYGFSGIVWAYIGFFLLLVAIAIGTYELDLYVGLRHHYILWPPLLFTSFLTSMVPIIFIFYFFGSHWTNMFGHVTGLFAGIVIPYLFLRLHHAKKRQNREYSSYSHLFTND